MTRRLLTAAALVAARAGCGSNPTPHPGQPGPGKVTGPDDTVGPPAELGPDEDGDGLPDCAEAGGSWDAALGECRHEGRPSDADGGALDADAGDVGPEVDAVDAADAAD